MGSEAEKEAAKSASSVAVSSKKKTKRAAGRKAGSGKPTKLKPGKAPKAKMPKKAPPKPAATPTAPRKHSTPAKRAKIIATANREGLTATQVQKRFGVKPITYYSWRKANKKAGSKAVPSVRGALDDLDVAGQVRLAVRAQIAKFLPQALESELAAVLGEAGDPRRGRPKNRL